MPLPASQPVVTQLTIDASGAAAGAAQYDAAMTKAEAVTNRMLAANDNLNAAYSKQADQMKAVAAANDNVAKSWGDVVSGAQSVGSSLEKTTENILNTINHLKLLALGIYAISPAFRSMVNSAIPVAIGAIGEAAMMAAKSVLSFMAPMLTFFAQITAPIAVAVLAWKGLVYVWQQGADLLDKYANFNRNNFTPQGAEQALAEATKFQQGDLSAGQIAYAAELGTRLDDANKKIQDFFKVSFDVTNLALGLQTIWVNIVEVIANVITKFQSFLDSVPAWIPKAVDVVARSIPGAGGLYAAAKTASDLGSGGSAAAGDQSPDAAISAARKTLAAGLAAKFSKGPQGGSFDARFFNFATQQPEEKDNSTNAYDRAIQSIKDQIDQLNLEAQGASKTSQAVQELKTAHTLNQAAMKAGIPVTDEMRAKWKDYADQIAALNIQIRQQQALQSEQFKGATMFMSPADQAAANVAHQIDPSDWQSHMHDLASETARFNSEMGQARDMSVNFLQSFNSDIVQGTVNMNTLTKAVQGFEMKFLDMAENQEINALFKSMTGGSGGGFLSFFGIGAPGGVLPGGAPLGQGGIGHNASGTDFWRGGPTWVGENGPEVVNLPRGAQVTPHSALSGPPQINVRVINNVGGDTKVGTPSVGSNGQIDLDVVIDQSAAKAAAKPGSALARTLKTVTGVQPSLTRR